MHVYDVYDETFSTLATALIPYASMSNVVGLITVTQSSSYRKKAADQRESSCVSSCGWWIWTLRHAYNRGKAPPQSESYCAQLSGTRGKALSTVRADMWIAVHMAALPLLYVWQRVHIHQPHDETHGMCCFWWIHSEPMFPCQVQSVWSKLQQQLSL